MKPGTVVRLVIGNSDSLWSAPAAERGSLRTGQVSPCDFGIVVAYKKNSLSDDDEVMILMSASQTCGWTYADYFEEIK